MKLISVDFEDQGDIPTKFTCQGEGISPDLAWENAPEGTKSFALELSDPDAPSGNFIHWRIINIPVSVANISAGKKIGDELPNTAGQNNYFPPCPPVPTGRQASGKHRYIFTLYALDIERIEPENTKNFASAIQSHIIGQAKLSGLYQQS